MLAKSRDAGCCAPAGRQIEEVAKALQRRQLAQALRTANAWPSRCFSVSFAKRARIPPR
jgi:hypothetical protein